MDARLQEMLDHHEIRKTLAEYCHACDRADAKLMGSVYTGDDSFDDHGKVRAPGPEYARMMTGTFGCSRTWGHSGTAWTTFIAQ